MPQISIIIPIYNTQEYLRECLDSVVNQTLRDIEIILVDDGSTDGSADICREYVAADSRIRLIMQENAGAAAARRTGAKSAVSPYIGFVDSDDTIEADMYETLLSYMGDCDLVTSVVQREEGDVWKDHLLPGIYRSQAEMQFVIDNMLIIGKGFDRGISGSMVCKVFRTDLVKKVFEDVDLRIYCNEDVEFICRYLLQCNSISVTDLCKYRYRTRNDSLDHAVHSDFMTNINLQYLSLCEAFAGHPREQRLLEQLQLYIAGYFPTLSVRMGFIPEAKLLRYINPFANELTEKKVALYGAGVVGKDYYLHMVRMGNEPVLWVDKQYEKYEKEYPVKAVEELERAEYDILVIAVQSKAVAENIKCELLSRGIFEGKIIWKEPIYII